MSFPTETTWLARVACRLAQAGLALMLLALLIVVGSLLLGGDLNAQFGFSTLLAVPGVSCGLVAIPLNIVAFYLPATRQTLRGERDATIGLLSSVIAVLLCCLLLSLAGAA